MIRALHRALLNDLQQDLIDLAFTHNMVTDLM